MNYATKPDQSSHWLLRVLYAIAAGICLLFGVIGLVLPIIPGIVFLAIGAMLLGKVSSRFAHFPLRRWPRSGDRYLQASAALSLTDRLRLGGWVIARGLMNGVRASFRAVSKQLAG
ncbi:MAG: hypothetical protein PsegKO_35310 [Pseudohongiellaceae bacterium]